MVLEVVNHQEAESKNRGWPTNVFQVRTRIVILQFNHLSFDCSTLTFPLLREFNSFSDSASLFSSFFFTHQQDNKLMKTESKSIIQKRVDTHFSSSLDGFIKADCPVDARTFWEMKSVLSVAKSIVNHTIVTEMRTDNGRELIKLMSEKSETLKALKEYVNSHPGKSKN
jgi:hypothetical protein